MTTHAQDDYDHLRENADAAAKPRPACERRIWVRGVDRPCGAEMGVTSWTDANGRTHTACRHHIVEVRYRYPEPVPA